MKHIFTLMFITLCLPIQIYSFSGEGTGDPSDPYQITNVDQLQEMDMDASAHYILMNDIDARETEEWNEGLGFVPIPQTAKFTGSLDGRGYSINNLYINPISYKPAGLFSSVGFQAIISNVKLIDCNISGNRDVGALAALNSGKIMYCSAYGIVNAQGNYAGGLIGSNSNGIILNCCAKVKVTGNKVAGGLVGITDRGLICCSFAAGIVSGLGGSNGLIGTNYDGLVCASFWDVDASNTSISAGGIGLTRYEMKDKTVFTDAGWNFDFAWKMEGSCPYLNLDFSFQPVDTDGDTYINISNINHLRWVSETAFYIDQYWEIDSDIDASETENWNGGYGFIPIENQCHSLEGNMKSIRNLHINWPVSDYVGFFSSIDFEPDDDDVTEIRNFILKDCSIKGQDFVGAIAGYNSTVDIKNCKVSGDITGNDKVGGFCGHHRAKFILESYAEVNISGNDYLGGIAGIFDYAEMEKCATAGDIYGNRMVGGLCGACYYFELHNTFSIAEVTGDTHAGGLSGTNEEGIISNSYSIGPVGDNSYHTGRIGGLAGYAKEVQADECFWDIESSGMDSSYVGVGLTTEEMKTKTTFTDAGWDFNTVWTISPESNEGYPCFQWMGSLLDVEELPDNKSISIRISPNPVIDYIHFSLPEPAAENIIVQVLDITGMSVREYSFVSCNGNITIPTNGIAPGAYFLRVFSGRQVFAEKFIVE